MDVPNRLLVCSNSGPTLPYRTDLGLQAAASGGLVPQVISLLEKFGGEWFFPKPWSDVSADYSREANGIALHPIGLSDQEILSHYKKTSIEMLLWTFHYLHATESTPIYNRNLKEYWRGYRQINKRFAESLARAEARGAGNTYLINDYHFMLVPGELERHPCSKNRQVIYVHHVPWCEPDYFEVLPESVRIDILESLLTCDVLVFHTKRWRDAFYGCCERNLEGVNCTSGGVEYRRKAIAVRTLQFPLDSNHVLELAGSEATSRWRQRFREEAGGRRLVVRVDRLDLWKNHIRGYEAFGELLVSDRSISNNAFFLSVAAPVRHETPRHAKYREECERRIASLNSVDSEPVASLSLPGDSDENRSRAIAALSEASAVLINSTYDGFNLVAAEALLVNSNASILLSRNCGSYTYLASAVHGLDPFDIGRTVEMLKRAVSYSERDQDGRRSHLRKEIMQYDSSAWLRGVLV